MSAKKHQRRIKDFNVVNFSQAARGKTSNKIPGQKKQ